MQGHALADPPRSHRRRYRDTTHQALAQSVPASENHHAHKQASGIKKIRLQNATDLQHIAVSNYEKYVMVRSRTRCGGKPGGLAFPALLPFPEKFG